MLKYVVGASLVGAVAVSFVTPDKKPIAEQQQAAAPSGFAQIASDYAASKTKTRKALAKTISRCVGVMDEKPLPGSVTRKVAEGWGVFAATSDEVAGDIWKAAAESLEDEIETLDKSLKRMSSRKRERIEAVITTRAPELARCTVEGYASFQDDSEADIASLRGSSSASQRPRAQGEMVKPTSGSRKGINPRLRADGTTDPASVFDQTPARRMEPTEADH